jgi:hypothetical protein
MGYLIPLIWFIIYFWIESNSQNRSEDLGSGIIVVCTFTIVLIFSVLSLCFGSLIAIRVLLMDNKLRTTSNVLFASFGTLGFIIIFIYIIFFLST